MTKLNYKLIVISAITLLLLNCVEESDPGSIDVVKNSIMEHGTRICFIGDPGTGGPAQFMVAEALSTENCDQVRVLGDVIYGDGIQSADDPQLKSKFYVPNKKLFDVDTPFYMVMGNHDHNGKIAPWLEVAENDDNVFYPNFYFAETWGDVCFFTIDTQAYYLAQSSWMKEMFSDLEDQCKFTFGLGHFPYKSVGGHGDAKNIQKKFLESTLVGHVDAYFAGHDHDIAYEGNTDGTHLIVSGSAGKKRHLERKPDPGNYAEGVNGYVIVTIIREDSKVSAEYEFRKVVAGKVETTFTGTIQGNGLRD